MPIYFQTVKQFSPVLSGVAILPCAVGLVISIGASGIITSCIHFYSPSMILASVLSSIGAGLLTTIRAKTKLWQTLVYQALVGIGIGAGLQGPIVGAQRILPEREIPMGTAAIQYAQTIGPAIFNAAAQNIFMSGLGVNTNQTSSNSEATSLPLMNLVRAGSPSDKTEWKDVAAEIGSALGRMFFLPMSLGCLSLIGAIGIGHIPMKTNTTSACCQDKTVR